MFGEDDTGLKGGHMRNSAWMMLVAAGMVLLSSTQDVHAISLATSFRAPLTTPYVVCGTEQSTSDCTNGSMELDSPWTFTAGTIEIDDNEVSLRLDDIQLVDGLDCDVDVGSGACNCWNDPNGTCTDDEGCEEGTEECGPRGNNTADNNYFKVKIFLQDKYSYGGTEKIRRDVNCHPEVYFDLKAVTGNMNRQVNDTQTVNIDGCGVNSGAQGAEIRHVEVLDKYNNRVAMPTH